MSLMFSPFYKEGNTLAGGLIIHTEKKQGLLKQIIVQAATSSTVFDFSISDGSSLQLFERESETGELNELLEMPILSPLVLTISNATRDELFKIYLVVQEN